MVDGEAELVVVETEGDRRTDAPISSISGRGVFVKEVQLAVLDGRADVAVHSAKDLTSGATPGLVIAAVPERGDARDALVGHRLAELRPGAVVATGSVRRRAQLAARRPDLTFAELRGNIGTRLEKAAGFDAIVVAAAALQRLGQLHRAAEVLEPSVLLPQVGQGALAVECREDDDASRRSLAGIEHGPSRAAVDAERAFLAAIEGGCDVPAAGYATVAGAGGVTLTGLLATLDGRVVIDHTATGPVPEEVGAAVAAHLLDRAGGRSLLREPLG